jgi:hypothetical protein
VAGQSEPCSDFLWRKLDTVSYGVSPGEKQETMHTVCGVGVCDGVEVCDGVGVCDGQASVQDYDATSGEQRPLGWLVRILVTSCTYRRAPRRGLTESGLRLASGWPLA